jgi:hypothetical protein
MLSDYGQGTEAIVDRHARVRKRGKQELLAFTAMTCGEGRAVTEVDQAFSDTPGADAERLCIYGVRRHLRARVQTQVIDQIRMVVVRENPPDLSPVAKVLREPVMGAQPFKQRLAAVAHVWACHRLGTSSTISAAASPPG